MHAIHSLFATRVSIGMLSASVLLSACAPRQPDAPASPLQQAVTTSIDLLSPATCTLRNGHLLNCAIAPRDLAYDPIDSAVPLRTTISSSVVGNCSTQFPLEVQLSTPGEDVVTLRYLGDPKAVVRHRDGSPVTALSLRDSSSWTKSAALDASCKVGLSVVPNEIDVDSREAAQAIIDRLQADLNNKTTLRERFGQLLLFSQAYGLMKQIADSLRLQLTNDQMQELRASAIDADAAFVGLILNCGSGLSDGDRTNLLRLYSSLSVLGRPEDWKNPDGTRKTLADFLGPTAAQIITTVDQLAGQADGSLAAQYQAEYQQAAADAAKADARLKLAKTQLAALLGG